MPEDEADLFAFIAKRDELVVVPSIMARTPQEVVEVGPLEYLKIPGAFGCAICTRGTILRCGVVPFGSPGNRSFGLPRSAEEVTYSRAVVVNGHLAVCNLSANWNYLSEDKTALVDKSPEFRKWAGRIFDWARRHATGRLEYSGYWYPATIRAVEAHRRGEFKVIL
jgi:hypothetical protein